MLETNIYWTITDFCRAQCDYCPTNARGGLAPKETSEYIRVIDSIVAHYRDRLGRIINWTLNGGELLDIDDIAIILKAMKTGNGSVSITTNGGKLWMDWWALEKYIDSVNLTFHFWQNPALMKYIVDTFKSKGKKFSITAPIRPTNVQEDIDRVLMLEDTIDMLVSKTQLYINGDSSIGMMNYSFDDLQKIDFFNLSKEGRIKFLEEQARRKTEAPPPPPVEKSALVKQAIYFKQTTWDDRYKDTYSQNPKYTGQLCNAGIECLYIEPNGWVTGSSCNNYPLGNIYQGFNPPGGPQKCGMIACVNKSDQLITKFPQPDQ